MGFAHRGLHDGAQIIENSFLAFAAAIERGAGIECDVRLTADDQLVVFHDADTHRLLGHAMAIGTATAAELTRYSLSGQPIPMLDQLLALIDGRVPLLIEVKVAERFRFIGPALLKALATYTGRVGVMSFDPRIARWLKINGPHVRRGLVIGDRLPKLRRWGAMKLTDPHFLAVDRAALGCPWVIEERCRRPVFSWTVRTAAERAEAAPLADALIWEANGRP